MKSKKSYFPGTASFTLHSLGFIFCYDNYFIFTIFNLLGESGEFSSPNYPSNYPANTLCTWKITGQPGKKIKVTFLDFDLQSGSGYYGYSCYNDWVRAFRGSYAYGWHFYE